MQLDINRKQLEIINNETRLRLKIPKKFQDYPIISQLTAKYNLQVSILRAILGANGEGDGWFDLLILGNQEQLDKALIYLSELGVEIWSKNNPELDSY